MAGRATRGGQNIAIEGESRLRDEAPTGVGGSPVGGIEGGVRATQRGLREGLDGKCELGYTATDRIGGSPWRGQDKAMDGGRQQVLKHSFISVRITQLASFN